MFLLADDEIICPGSGSPKSFTEQKLIPMIAVRSLKSEVCRGHIMPYNDSGTPCILVFLHNKRTQPKKLNFLC